jgi:dienelactone hydrolase
MGRFLTLAAILLFVTPFASPVAVKAGQQDFLHDEKVKVQSLTLTTEQFLGGNTTNGVPVTLTGELRSPNWSERLPVVVLLHGSDGIASQSTIAWRSFLNDMGIATFRLDSFHARGFYNVENDQSRLSLFAQIYDAYRAVDVIAANPRIDPSRIAVMGFSRGGFAALYASMTRFYSLYGPATAKITAYLPFYPLCSIQLVGELDVVAAPIREFHGAADDWTPAAPCRDFFARLRAAGKDAEMIEYQGAQHAFDNPDAQPTTVQRKAQTSRNCRRREQNGQIINLETGRPFSYDDACVQIGPTAGYDKAATESARTAVKKFLTELFHIN